MVYLQTCFVTETEDCDENMLAIQQDKLPRSSSTIQNNQDKMYISLRQSTFLPCVHNKAILKEKIIKIRKVIKITKPERQKHCNKEKKITSLKQTKQQQEQPSFNQYFHLNTLAQNKMKTDQIQ